MLLSRYYGGKVYTTSECQTELNEVDEDEFKAKETEGTKTYVKCVGEEDCNKWVYVYLGVVVTISEFYDV